MTGESQDIRPVAVDDGHDGDGGGDEAYHSVLRLRFDSERGPGGGTPDGRPELADLGRLAKVGLRKVVRTARAVEPTTIGDRIRDHLGADLESLTLVQQNWPTYELVNLQLALDAWTTAPGRSAELLGLTRFQHRQFGFGDLIDSSEDPRNVPGLGQVSRVNQASGPGGQVLACVQAAVYLVDTPVGPVALLLRPFYEGRPQVQLDAVAMDPSVPSEIIADLRRLTHDLNVFRGQVLSFGGDIFDAQDSIMSFRDRPTLSAEQLILDPGVLHTIERHIVGVAKHRDALRSAGQHLKRGLLLYGPPGVGKTHTIRYLISVLTNTTVVIVSGDALRFLAEAASVARSLQPAIVVIEDVDLVAEERHRHGPQPLLFELLNQMDGLGDDVDVAFILTTNRADMLEPALAQRPGRIDQAVELTLPDVGARRALFELYRGDLDITADDAELERMLRRCEGVTASFLKEWLRRSTLVAAERRDPEPAGVGGAAGESQVSSTSAETALQLTGADLGEALDELLDGRNRMTRTMLGGAAGEPAPGVDADLLDPTPAIHPGAHFG